MSLLSRISKGGGAPLPDPDRQPQGDGLVPPAGPERLPAASTSQPQAVHPQESDGIIWRLLEQIGRALSPTGGASRSVERGERDQRMLAIEEHALPILQQEGISLTPTERAKVFSRLYDELFGLGPLESLLTTPRSDASSSTDRVGSRSVTAVGDNRSLLPGRCPSGAHRSPIAGPALGDTIPHVATLQDAPG